LKPGAAAGALLKTLTIEISRASRTTTHGIALEAVTIRTRLGPGAATELPPVHGAVISHSLGSAIVGRGWWCVTITTVAAAVAAAITAAITAAGF
jgi:hypothetical protein